MRQQQAIVYGSQGVDFKLHADIDPPRSPHGALAMTLSF